MIIISSIVRADSSSQVESRVHLQCTQARTPDQRLDYRSRVMQRVKPTMKRSNQKSCTGSVVHEPYNIASPSDVYVGNSVSSGARSPRAHPKNDLRRLFVRRREHSPPEAALDVAAAASDMIAA